MTPKKLKSDAAPIKAYHATLQTYADHDAVHEGATETALHWVIDQYQASTDKHSGIVSDPNRADDPQYITRLVGQVVKVSVETVRIIKGLPAQYARK